MARTARAAGLGDFVEAYELCEWSVPAEQDRQWPAMVVMGVVFCLPIGILLAGLLVGWWLALLLVVVLGVGSWVEIRATRGATGRSPANRSILQFQGGLVCCVDAQAQAFRWSDFAEVYQNPRDVYLDGRYTTSSYSYDLRGPDGLRLTLTGNINDKVASDKVASDKVASDTVVSDKVAADIVGLGAAVVEELIARLLPGTLNTIQAGGSVEFGTLKAQFDGVHTPAGMVPWTAPQAYQVDRGVFKIRVRALRRWKRDIKRIPNFMVLWTLIQLGPGVVTPQPGHPGQPLR